MDRLQQRPVRRDGTLRAAAPSCRPLGLGRLAWVLAVLVCSSLLACSDDPPPQRKPQVVKLLPDTPPPPPPPPKPQDKPPPPKPDDKPAPPAPKPEDVPQAQALKTDEAAGDGPGSGLQSGAVTQEYSGQPLGSGTGGGGPALGAQRLAAASWASAANREIGDFLQADKSLRRHDYRLQVHLWLDGRGRIVRAELLGSTGEPAVDDALREALQRFPGTRIEPPPGLPLPLRVQLSNRMLG